MKANNAYERAKHQVTELETLVDVWEPLFLITILNVSINTPQIFKSTLRNRKNRWRLFRAHISSRAKAQFTYLLSERSFRGRLLADHDAKLLDLQVTFSQMPFATIDLIDFWRSSQILQGIVQDGAQRLFLEGKSLSHKFASCCHSGKPWDHPFAVLMNCSCYNSAIERFVLTWWQWCVYGFRKPENGHWHARMCLYGFIVKVARLMIIRC